MRELLQIPTIIILGVAVRDLLQIPTIILGVAVRDLLQIPNKARPHAWHSKREKQMGLLP